LVFVFGSFQIIEAHDKQQLKLQVNQEKKISKSGVTVKFVSVLEDSRCPVDTNCIWAGNAKIQIKLRKSKSAWKTFELNSNSKPETITFEGYEIKLTDLNPKMRSNIRINRNGYIATFAINHQTKS